MFHIWLVVLSCLELHPRIQILFPIRSELQDGGGWGAVLSNYHKIHLENCLAGDIHRGRTSKDNMISVSKAQETTTDLLS